MPLNPNQRRDRRTGKVHSLSRAKSMAAKRGARKRGHKHESAATRMKIMKAVKRAIKTGRTEFGRRVRKRA